MRLARDLFISLLALSTVACQQGESATDGLSQQVTTIGWSFDGLALIFFVAVLYSLWTKRPAGNTSVAAILAVFCALMGNPDRFQTFKFSFTGIETSARQAIQQVQVTIEQLQKLASALAEGNLDELAFSSSIFVGMSTAAKFRIRDQIVDRLQDIGIGKADRLKAQHGWIILNPAVDAGHRGNLRPGLQP